MICKTGPSGKKRSLNNWTSNTHTHTHKSGVNPSVPTFPPMRNNFLMLLLHLGKYSCRISFHRSVWEGRGRKGAAEGDCASWCLQEQQLDSVSKESLAHLATDNCFSIRGEGISCDLLSLGMPKGKRLEGKTAPKDGFSSSSILTLPVICWRVFSWP